MSADHQYDAIDPNETFGSIQAKLASVFALPLSVHT